MAEQLGVRRLLEDDHRRPQRGERHVQTTTAGKGPQLRGEVLQVSPRSAAQEYEHVIVEAFCPRAIDYYVGHGQHLEGQRKRKRMEASFDCFGPVPTPSHHYLQQKPHSLILTGCRSQKSLRVQGNQTQVGVVRRPHAHCAGAGGLGRVEHLPSPKQNAVQSVGLAVSGVAKDREDLDSCHIPTTKFVHKIRLAADLKGEE